MSKIDNLTELNIYIFSCYRHYKARLLSNGRFEVHWANETIPTFKDLQEVIDFFVNKSGGAFQPLLVNPSNEYDVGINYYDTVPGTYVFSKKHLALKMITVHCVVCISN